MCLRCPTRLGRCARWAGWEDLPARRRWPRRDGSRVQTPPGGNRLGFPAVAGTRTPMRGATAPPGPRLRRLAKSCSRGIRRPTNGV